MDERATMAEADGIGQPPASPRFATIDAAVRNGLGTLYPGAVLMIAHEGRVVHAAAFGHAQTLGSTPEGAPDPLGRPRPMRTDTIFDLASVTKVAATTVAVLQLVDSGRLGLDDRLATLLPGFAGTEKAGVTVRHLLTHRAGLWEWQPTWLHRAAEGGVGAYLATLPLRYPIDARFAYSDLGFMLLGEIVAHVAGIGLDHYVRDHLYGPLGMAETGFRPAAERRARCAATSLGDAYQRHMAESGVPYPAGPIAPPAGAKVDYRHHMLVGDANDANAALGWDGVAGHAGLFAPAADLLKLTQALLDAHPRIAARATLARFEETSANPEQALGFRAFAVPGLGSPFLGHPGFTGTFLAYSRALSAGVVLLTNRVHRDDRDGAPPPMLAELHDCLLRSMVGVLGPCRSPGG